MKRRPWTPATAGRKVKSAILRRAPRYRPVLTAFARWLRNERALAPGSVAVRVGSASTFVVAAALGHPRVVAALRSLTPSRIEDLFVAYCRDHGASARRSMQAAIRLVLRFAVSRGWLDAGLIEAVPSLRTYRLSTVPRGLSAKDVQRLLGSLSEPGTSTRDLAIVLLLANFGIRRGQVAQLQLADIDWHTRTVTFRAHKGGKAVRHVMTSEVGMAIARYLEHERPRSALPHVFLRQRAPHLALAPNAVTEIVRARLIRLGIGGVPCGPHALRHAFASRLLAARCPLKSIADLLGHRSLSATSVYAKVDQPRLFEVAVEWPEVQP